MPFRSATWATAVLLVSLLLAGCVSRGSSDLPPFTDTTGKPAPVQTTRDTKAVAVITLSMECPLSNKVLPEIRDLEARFAQEGIRFVYLYPNVDETDDAVEAHRREFGITAPALRDPQSVWLRRFELSVTPQALVVTPDGRLVYRGRIHDQFASLGAGKPAPSKHDLADALGKFLSSGKAEGMTTKAIGCRIRIHPASKTL